MSKADSIIADADRILIHANHLREWLLPGDTLHTILKHVSRSGLSRTIAVVSIGEDGEPLDISYFAASATGRRYDDKHGGVVVQGGGMDMGFELVYTLSRTLWPDGFACIGEDCPANDHHNAPHPLRVANGMLHKDAGYALRQRWLT